MGVHKRRIKKNSPFFNHLHMKIQMPIWHISSFILALTLSPTMHVLQEYDGSDVNGLSGRDGNVLAFA